MPERVPPAGPSTRRALCVAGALGLALVAAPLAALPAQANVAGTDVVISELYLNGGSAGASYLNKYVELYNPTAAPISLAGTSIQYRSPTGTANPSGKLDLAGVVPAGGYFLVSGGSNGANGAALPTPDQVGAGQFNPGAAGGTVFLADSTSVLQSPPTGSIVNNPAIIDVVGYGSSTTFEGTAATNATGTTSISRNATNVDTDDNGADFTRGTPSPTAAGTVTPPTTPPTGEPTAPPTTEPTTPPTTPPVDPGTVVPISAIQGTGDASPLAGQTVTTTGVVTAAFPTGGINGYYIQTSGTGGAIDLATHTASDGLFVYSASTVSQVAVGDTVRLTGEVTEFYGLTQLVVPTAAGLTKLPASAPPVPATVALPATAAQRESLEGMLIAPQGDFTVSNTYSTNQYAEIGLASGTTPQLTPTEVARPGTPEYAAVVADNAARAVTLDDGSTLNFLSNANKSVPLPYVSNTAPVRVGAAVEFTTPVILDYRNDTWKFQPLTQLTPANAATVQPASFENTRTAAPEAVGGDISIASFNVLNYFTTTGDQLSGCTYYTDRAGNRITVNSGCDARGAANATSLERQQAKIVAAINALDADVVSLEEIENSAKFGKPRDEALSILTAALNAAAGSEVWAYVASPSVLPSLASEDVIRTAFIYKKATVETVGESIIHDDAAAFSNARKPLAQEFRLIGDEGSEFVAIVNHFKSKGSGSGADADQNDGQGASNASRVAQANSLLGFANGLEQSKGTDKVFLIGDFNAYSQEDPVQVFLAAGYVDQGSKSGKYTYSFSGQSGSLDHIYASAAANAVVTGTDVWNINSGESIALEYSRHNYNVLDFYEATPYRSSDHDPIVVGLALASEPVDEGAIAALTAFGPSKTVETGAAVSGLGVTAATTAGAAATAREVVFTIEGPASFTGGAFSATVATNAAGTAVLPALTAGPIAGTVTVTATANGVSTALAPITVVVPSAVLELDASASTSIVAGRVVVTVSAVNAGDTAATITLKSRYGTKTFVNVAPGASVSADFRTGLARIPAGTGTVTGVAPDGSQLTKTPAYAAAQA